MEYEIVLVLVAAASATTEVGYNPIPYASPVVTAEGFLQDTPEVAAAKAAHYSAHAIAESSPSNYDAAEESRQFTPSVRVQPPPPAPPAFPASPAFSVQRAPSFTAPRVAPTFAAPPAPPTFAVQQAPAFRAQHSPPAFAAQPAPLSAEAQSAPPGSEVTPDGYLAETADVARARAAHYAAHASALGVPVDPYIKYLSSF